MSCPAGFDVGVSNTCHITCPAGYAYTQDSTGQRCVSAADSKYFVPLQDVPRAATTTAFANEQARFLSAFITLTRKVQTDQAAALQLKEAETDDVSPRHDAIRSTHGVAGAYTETIEALRPLRPPTQPATDIETMRLSTLQLANQSARPIQLCLFFIILTIIEYLILPSSVVHGAAFLTLCVGLSLAIYLYSK